MNGSQAQRERKVMKVKHRENKKKSFAKLKRKKKKEMNIKYYIPVILTNQDRKTTFYICSDCNEYRKVCLIL